MSLRNEYDFKIYEYFSRNIRVCNLTTDKSETVIRCPFCGDSTKNEYHAHLYINNVPPFKWYCQKCSNSGIVDDKFLKAVKLYDPEMITYVAKSKSEYIKNLNRKYGNNFLELFNKDFNLLPNDYTKLELKKIKYVNNRLGIEIDSEEEIEKYKLILNLKDFFENNELKMNDYYKQNINYLNKNFVGFFLNDKNMICFRNINKNPDPRYINKKIYSENIIQSRKFFTITNNLNLNNIVFNLYMTEGIFDIMGVYNHIYNCKQNDNDLFISCNGKSYAFVLNYLKTLGILNCNINIFSDKDVPKSKFESLMKYNDLCKFNGINLYYNSIGKDYGVRKDEIVLQPKIVL